MTKRLEDADFGAAYYALGCGRPYARDDVWMARFRDTADGIVRTLRPTRVLDAACAWGLLVEALRARGVEAFGFDISSYAIDQVEAATRPFCWQASVTREIEGRYDLIVCIEVLAHLTEEDGRAAVATFCRHTDTVLCSAGKYPPHPRHLNDFGPDDWTRVFESEGFRKDTSVDLTFVTPWTALYCRRRM